jgi:ATP-binding cassette subfamily B protein
MFRKEQCDSCKPLVSEWYYVALVAIGVAVAIINVAINFVQGGIVRQLENLPQSSFDWSWVYVWLGCFVAPTILEALRGHLANRIQNRLLIQDRHDLTELLARVRYETHEGSTFREGVQFLEKNSWRHWQYLDARFQLIGATVSTVVGAIALASLSWIGLFVLLFAAVPLCWATSHYGRRWHEVSERISDPTYRSYCVSEQFSRLKPVALIKMFGLEGLLLSVFGGLTKDILNTQEKTAREDLLARLVSNTIVQIVGAFIVLTVIWLLESGDVAIAKLLVNRAVTVDLGLLYTTLGLTTGFMAALRSLVFLQGSLAQHGPYMRKRIALMSSIKLDRSETLDPIDRDGMEIQFVNVSFKYPNARHWVFRNLNLTLRTGERVALLGDNGAGKSTLFKLLSGLYTPTSGQILINGQPLSSIDPDEYRQKVAFMLQDQEPVEGITVSQLISSKLHLTESDLDRVVEACEKTGASVFIERLPQGYDSPIGPKTTRSDLSGGERQRVALAQVLFRRPRLALLDEPTSALDFGGKEKILEILRNLPETTGFIVAAHEPLVISLVTRIIVLERGGGITDHALTSGAPISSPYFERMSQTYRSALGL